MSAREWQRQYQAVMRLQLYVQMRVHETLAAAASAMREAVTAVHQQDGRLTPAGLMGARVALERIWKESFDAVRALITAAQREAASMPFGTLAELHAHYIGTLGRRAVQEAMQGAGEHRRVIRVRRLDEAAAPDDYLFKPQLDAIMKAANRAVYADGLTLSGRLWRLDQQSRAGIQAVLFAGAQGGKSAWDIAKELEKYLGANANCPRWTSTRLYRLTKRDIAAGDPRGLIRGDECASQGVAYNALRLARTEIQRIHNLATQTLMKQMPWVAEEQMRLSPAHPEEDVCDEIIARGRDGKGIYPVGMLSLPIHPNCLCYLVAVEMPADDFVGQLRGWMRGERSWPEMDGYAQTFGAQLSPAMNLRTRTISQDVASGAGVATGIMGGIVASAILQTLLAWLMGDRAAHDSRMESVPMEVAS
jgi:hypothetical protein